MTIIEKLEALMAPSLESLGYGVVRILFWGDKPRILQIMIERLDETLVGIEDCVSVSQHVSALLDVEDLIEESYNLEVTSPGLERPLVKLKDFERFVGQKARIESHLLVSGRKRFQGVLRGVEEERIMIEGEDYETVSIPYTSIHKARLIWEEPEKGKKITKKK